MLGKQKEVNTFIISGIKMSLLFSINVLSIIRKWWLNYLCEEWWRQLNNLKKWADDKWNVVGA